MLYMEMFRHKPDSRYDSIIHKIQLFGITYKETNLCSSFLPFFPAILLFGIFPPSHFFDQRPTSIHSNHKKSP